MNTEITLEQIKNWITAKQNNLDFTGIECLSIAISPKNVYISGWGSKEGGYASAFGNTIEEAYAKIRQKLPTGSQRAEKLIKQAHELLAEAEKLKGENK